MRPYLFGVALLGGWTLIAAGALANLAGVEGVGNKPSVLVPVVELELEAQPSPPDSTFDASVPLAGARRPSTGTSL